MHYSRRQKYLQQRRLHKKCAACAAFQSSWLWSLLMNCCVVAACRSNAGAASLPEILPLQVADSRGWTSRVGTQLHLSIASKGSAFPKQLRFDAGPASPGLVSVLCRNPFVMFCSLVSASLQPPCFTVFCDFLATTCGRRRQAPWAQVSMKPPQPLSERGRCTNRSRRTSSPPHQNANSSSG